jgi:hypothetical protein
MRSSLIEVFVSFFVSQSKSENSILEEEQCEHVDMNNELLDPLEWSVRKIIPIPKKYYFETGHYGVSFRTKLWHRSIQAMGLALNGIEKIGGFVANTLGLTSSRYDDVLAYMTEEELEQARQKAWLEQEQRNAHSLQQKQKNALKIDVV